MLNYLGIKLARDAYASLALLYSFHSMEKSERRLKISEYLRLPAVAKSSLDG